MQRTITVKANSERTENIKGGAFCVVACTAAFDLEAGHERRTMRGAGGRFVGEKFKRLTFIETNGADNIIVFEAGDTERDISAPVVSSTDFTSFMKDAPTYSVGTGVISMADGSNLYYLGTNAGNQRKQIVIRNNSAVADGLELLVSAAGVNDAMDVISPKSTHTYISSGVFNVLNRSGTAIDVVVGETFYSP